MVLRVIETALVEISLQICFLRTWLRGRFLRKMERRWRPSHLTGWWSRKEYLEKWRAKEEERHKGSLPPPPKKKHLCHSVIETFITSCANELALQVQEQSFFENQRAVFQKRLGVSSRL
jgi:hypothetical protein